jgi:hypothetical protein
MLSIACEASVPSVLPSNLEPETLDLGCGVGRDYLKYLSGHVSSFRNAYLEREHILLQKYVGTRPNGRLHPILRASWTIWARQCSYLF